MRILFLSRWYPYPADNGSKIRVAGLLRALCVSHEVTLVSFVNPAETQDSPPHPGPVATRVCAYHEFDPGRLRAIAGFVGRTPRFLLDTYNPEMARHIRQTVADTRPDLVIASQLPTAAYRADFAGMPAIFEEVEVGIYRTREPQGSRVGRLRRRLTWAKHRRYLAGLLQHFTCCTVASEAERQLLARAVPAYPHVHVVPNGVDPAAEPHGGDRVEGALVFAGSLRYVPNRDAMAWFVSEVFPAIRAQASGVRLTITGGAGPLPFAPASDIVLTGHVSDVRPLVASAAVSLAPIRQGGGTRLKVLEAMALRTPVVATTTAVEGLDVRDGEHLLIADTPGEFAAAVLRVLRNRSEAGAMADRAWHLFQARYDARMIGADFVRLVERVYSQRCSGRASTRRGAVEQFEPAHRRPEALGLASASDARHEARPAAGGR